MEDGALSCSQLSTGRAECDSILPVPFCGQGTPALCKGQEGPEEGPFPGSRLGRPQETPARRAGREKGKEGLVISAAEAWPRSRQNSNPVLGWWAAPAADSPAARGSPMLAARRPALFTSPLSHTGCQEAEDPRIKALPQLLLLAACLAGSGTAQGTTSPPPTATEDSSPPL